MPADSTRDRPATLLFGTRRSRLKRSRRVPIYPPGRGENTGARVCMAMQKRAGGGLSSDRPFAFRSRDNAPR